VSETVRDPASAIAVIGIACRLPGAEGPDELWKNLCQGVESITRFSREELLAAGVDARLVDHPDFVPARGVIDGIENFDAELFGFSPREAELIDPQQRLFLECAWHALEDAGHDPTQDSRPVGAFAAVTMSTYLSHNLRRNPERIADLGMQVLLGNDKDFVATSAAYRLHLTGPCMTVQTACSSSLVATYLACQSLLDYQCDLALAGGVSLVVPSRGGALYRPGGMISRDGRCRAFDAGADGCVMGNGLGVVVLKRLGEALDDGDRIYAVITGSAVNNDGSDRAGFAAPGVRGQARAVAMAQAAAGIVPADVGYVEAHGMGTPLGDAVEVAALRRVFGSGGAKRPPHLCYLGSIKPNIGHLDAAAGIASLIKTVLAVRHGQVPPSLNFRTPNPRLELEDSPFAVADRLLDWPVGGPRRAGVHSFGIGGTNAHVIVEQAPPSEPSSETGRRPCLVVLSAASRDALEAASDNLARHLEEDEETQLADVAFTLQVGRRCLSHRRALVCRDRAAAAAVLRRRDSGDLGGSAVERSDRPVCFLLSGSGGHHVGMGLGLYRDEPTFRGELDACAERLVPELGIDLRTLLYPRDARREGGPPDVGPLARQCFAEPAVFALGHALARLWESWGVRPETLLGHGLGEYLAACLAGTLSRDDALRLVAGRARLLEELPPQAVHTPAVEPVVGRFRELLSQVELRAPHLPWLTNVSGTWITPREATDPEHWCRHLRQPVRFADALAELWNVPEPLLLEVGPGEGLADLALRHPAAPAGALSRVARSLLSSEDPAEDLKFLEQARGKLWMAGATVRWQDAARHVRRCRVSLPGYPFQRRRYWVEPAAPDAGFYLPSRQTAGAAADGLYDRPRLRTTPVAPRDPVEAGVAEIWSGLLGIREIGVHDSFFELGGHSLLATQVNSRVRERFRVELTVRDLFDDPTVAGMSSRIAGQKAVEAPGAPRTEWPRLTAGARGDRELPLSFAQERLWFLNALEVRSTAYNIPIVLRLEGALDGAALAASFRKIVQRHEALRTTFAQKDGRTMQVICPVPNHRFGVVDLSGQAAGAAEARRLTRREADRPFDLARGPLLRVLLFHLAQDDHLLMVNIHHIVSDGWSMGVMVRELTAFYQGQTLPDLPIQNADFAVWQRDFLQGQRLAAEVDWWREQLAGAPQVLELPTDRPRPPVRPYHGAVLPVRVPSRPLKVLSQEQGTTLFMSLLAAFQVLLSRHSHQYDLVVGSPIANRHYVETEDLIGLFVNTLVFRGDLRGDPSFRDLLAQVRERTLGAYAHQDLPFEKLVDALQPERDPSRSPLFQAMFVLQNAPFQDLELPGLVIRFPETEKSAAQFDLKLSLAEAEDALVGTLEYCTELWDRVTLHRLQLHFAGLLEELCDHPERRIGELSLISAAEKHQLSLEWNDTDVAEARPQSLTELFESQASRTPDAVALEIGAQFVTYDELRARTDHLAGRLRDLEVGPEVRVAISLERSPELMVGLLSILKAGGAYVPLDPSYPKERLAFMLRDSGAAVVVERDPVFGRLALHGTKTVHAPRRDQDVRDVLAPEQLAYMIYTSGSTGRPKGTMNSHRAICNRLFWMQKRYSLTPADRVLQKTSISFDVSVWEFFWPLLVGARLVMARPEGHRISAYLASLIVERRVTVLHFVPSMLGVFLREPGLSDVTNLRRIITSGEALMPEHERLFFKRFRHLKTELHNLYGPTEAAIDVTSHTCAPDGAVASVPIGRPVFNTRIHLLDRALGSVPIGVAGHLHIGGIQVGRGYLGRPGQTAGSFIPDPFAEVPDQRLYRTGDLARLATNGEVEFLGRIDHQVKIRGFRIEPGEIESFLERQASVRQAVVTVRSYGTDDRRLVAYVVLDGGGPQALKGLRESARQYLPPYMVPSHFVALDALPVTTSGKVDQRALPAPEGLRPLAAGSYQAPRSALERRLIAIWQEVLGLGQVGIDDNFFDLGGHSLLLLKVHDRLQREISPDLPLLVLFQSPTVRTLASALRPSAPAAAEDRQPQRQAGRQRLRRKLEKRKLRE
jgi:amino acid adenylation domain-containing protein